MSDKFDAYEKVKEFNDRIKALIAERDRFIKEVAEPAHAKFKIGDDIYNVETGELLGTVSKIYRYKEDEDTVEASLDFEYEYRERGNCFNNTSSQYWLTFGTKADVERRLKDRLALLDKS